MASFQLTGIRLIEGRASQQTAGEAISAGELVYFNTTDNTVYKASSTTPASAVIAGIALTGAAVDTPVLIAADRSLVSTTASLAIDEIYYLSSTAGNIELATDIGSGEDISLLGIATTTGRIQLNLWNTGITKS